MPLPTDTLQSLMQAANLKSYRAIAQKANVSRWQIQQLRHGNISKMRVESLANISAALEISLTSLLAHFLSPDTPTQAQESPEKTTSKTTAPSEKEPSEKEPSEETFQIEALQTLETWLIQWPTIAQRVQTNPELSAAKLLPFIRPIEQLMRDWNIEPIATIDEQLPYDPTHHQLTKGTANPGDLVQVTHTGHTHTGKLLHRAKVKPV